MIRLSSYNQILDVDPSLGGSVTGYRFADIDILRRTEAPNDPKQTSAFPMVPFASRITKGKFAWRDQQIGLPPNMPPEPHAIHGFGWQSPWQVYEASDTHVTLRHTYNKADWPQPYSCIQTLTLTPNGLSVSFELTNTGNAAMPAGLGWHPFFPIKDADVMVPTSEIWMQNNDSGFAPQEIPERYELCRPKAAESLDIDHVFTVVQPKLDISWPTHSISLQSDDLFGFSIIYTSQDGGFICLEPVSHAPDAVNSDLPTTRTGLKVLEAGETLHGTIRLNVSLV